jgi:single-strand DNA-binding protein
MNNVSLIGNIGTDIELKTTPTGKNVCTFPLAVKDRERTLWINIVAWNKTAELCEKYLMKGSQVGIEGRIAVREYTNKNNEKRKIVEVIADEITFIGKKHEITNEENTEMIAGYQEVDMLENDLPF